MKREVAEILLDIQAVKLNSKNPYIFASGIKSPIYCDNRLILSFPEKRDKIISFFIELIKIQNIEFDIVAGIATAGIPHAAFIAERLNKPMIYVRSKPKAHGRSNQIEGILNKGQKVLVVEDLISTGGSSLNAIEAIINNGGNISACLAIFTYNMKKSIDSFKNKNIPLFTLSDFNSLVEVAVKNKIIDPSVKDHILVWNKDPENWKINLDEG